MPPKRAAFIRWVRLLGYVFALATLAVPAYYIYLVEKQSGGSAAAAAVKQAVDDYVAGHQPATHPTYLPPETTVEALWAYLRENAPADLSHADIIPARVEETWASVTIQAGAQNLQLVTHQPDADSPWQIVLRPHRHLQAPAWVSPRMATLRAFVEANNRKDVNAMLALCWPEDADLVRESLSQQIGHLKPFTDWSVATVREDPGWYVYWLRGRKDGHADSLRVVLRWTDDDPANHWKVVLEPSLPWHADAPEWLRNPQDAEPEELPE